MHCVDEVKAVEQEETRREFVGVVVKAWQTRGVVLDSNAIIATSNKDDEEKTQLVLVVPLVVVAVPALSVLRFLIIFSWI
mmetsp:Transcript_15058/g.28805  ORF Transcript_15058/g.28805 Transcript_15058/m.28805 type:complete len:80 (+) Transcript_15058:1961-2200(+)